MTAAGIVAHYARLNMPIPPDVMREITPAVGCIGGKPVTVPDVKKLKQPKQPNQTEREFGMMLRARRVKMEKESWPEFDRVQFEGARLRLADALTYTPDWMCTQYSTVDELHRVTFFEVKGRKKWDDAIAKFKMAKEIHKWARFEMWQKLDGQWSQIF
jgi:hypothetical protein